MGQASSAFEWEGDVRDLPVPAAVLDSGGRVLSLSPTASALLGRSEEDARGHELQELLGELGNSEVRHLDLPGVHGVQGAPGPSEALQEPSGEGKHVALPGVVTLVPEVVLHEGVVPLAEKLQHPVACAEGAECPPELLDLFEF